MAAFFSTYMFMVLGLLIKLKGFSKKLPLGFLFFFCLWCLLFSYSRGAYVAALGGLVFIGALFNRKILVLLIVASFFWKSIVPISVVERIEMTTSEVEHAGSSSESRLSMWQHGIKLFLKNPIGYGLDSVQFLGFRKNYSVIDVGEFRMKRDTHNKYIEFLVEMGLIGISLFLYLFYLALKRARAVYTATGDSVFGGLALGFAASIVSLMIVNLFGDRWTYIPLAAFFWVLWALTTRSFLILQQETASDSTDTQYLNP
jgi:O-antigen ligase